MSSNRRTRPSRPPYRPEDEDIIETQAPRRDPRRRSPYVPRQQAPREEPLYEEYDEEPQPRQRAARPRQGSARQQPQQPAWRQSRQAEPQYGEIDAYLDEDAYDDRVIQPDRQAPRQARRARPAETRAEPLYE